MTFKDDLRKILEDYSNYCYVGIEDTSSSPLRHHQTCRGDYRGRRDRGDNKIKAYIHRRSYG